MMKRLLKYIAQSNVSISLIRTSQNSKNISEHICGPDSSSRKGSGQFPISVLKIDRAFFD